MRTDVKNETVNERKARGQVRFQPGNKFGHGRPRKEICIPDMLRGIGNEPIPPLLLAQLQAAWGPDFRPKNMRDAGLRVTYAQYVKGDASARQFVAERTEGKVTDEVNFNNDQTITHKHSFDFGKMSVSDIDNLRKIVAKGTAREEQPNNSPRVSRPLSPSFRDN